MDIIMIRHGESEDNISKVYSREDTGLTDKGKKEILGAKLLLEDIGYKNAYYSPFKRAFQSYEILELKASPEDRIKEIDFGIFTGKTFGEISEIYPEESKAWISDVINYRVPQGESVLDVYRRVEKFLEELIDKGEDTLLICHDCVIRVALCWVFDNPDYFFKFKIDNGSINIISIDDDYKFIKRTNYKTPI